MSGIDRDSDGDPGTPREPTDAEPPQQAGVLGNLPKKRPSVRSPRRAEPKRASGREEAPAGTAPKTAARTPPPGDDGAPAAAEPEHSAAADLEGLARGGIAIAGGAASLGLKLAGRAAAALRDAVERR